MPTEYGKLRATDKFTDRLYDSLLAGPETLPDVALAYVDPERVPELLDLIDERVAGLRALRHKLVTLATPPGEMNECARCGGPFATRRSGQVYCSNACRQAAYRYAKKA